jgi:hypothetical protein
MGGLYAGVGKGPHLVTTSRRNGGNPTGNTDPSGGVLGDTEVPVGQQRDQERFRAPDQHGQDCCQELDLCKQQNVSLSAELARCRGGSGADSRHTDTPSSGTNPVSENDRSNPLGLNSTGNGRSNSGISGNDGRIVERTTGSNINAITAITPSISAGAESGGDDTLQAQFNAFINKQAKSLEDACKEHFTLVTNAQPPSESTLLREFLKNYVSLIRNYFTLKTEHLRFWDEWQTIKAVEKQRGELVVTDFYKNVRNTIAEILYRSAKQPCVYTHQTKPFLFYTQEQLDVMRAFRKKLERHIRKHDEDNGALITQIVANTEGSSSMREMVNLFLYYAKLCDIQVKTEEVTEACQSVDRFESYVSQQQTNELAFDTLYNAVTAKSNAPFAPSQQPAEPLRARSHQPNRAAFLTDIVSIRNRNNGGENTQGQSGGGNCDIAKYTTMLKNRVPEGAVRQNMTLAGCNEIDIEKVFKEDDKPATTQTPAPTQTQTPWKRFVRLDANKLFKNLKIRSWSDFKILVGGNNAKTNSNTGTKKKGDFCVQELHNALGHMHTPVVINHDRPYRGEKAAGGSSPCTDAPLQKLLTMYMGCPNTLSNDETWAACVCECLGQVFDISKSDAEKKLIADELWKDKGAERSGMFHLIDTYLEKNQSDDFTELQLPTSSTSDASPEKRDPKDPYTHAQLIIEKDCEQFVEMASTQQWVDGQNQQNAVPFDSFGKAILKSSHTLNENFQKRTGQAYTLEYSSKSEDDSYNCEDIRHMFNILGQVDMMSATTMSCQLPLKLRLVLQPKDTDDDLPVQLLEILPENMLSQTRQQQLIDVAVHHTLKTFKGELMPFYDLIQSQSPSLQRVNKLLEEQQGPTGKQLLRDMYKFHVNLSTVVKGSNVMFQKIQNMKLSTKKT